MLEITSRKVLILFMVVCIGLFMVVGCDGILDQIPITTEYTLTMQVEGQGTVNPVVGTHTYKDGMVVTLNATPAEGWRLKEWVGDVADTKLAETTSLMNKSKAIKVVFVPKEIIYLKDLGIEGRLEENADYSIHDHTVLGYWSVSFLKSKVSPIEANVALIIEREVFPFTSNPLHQDIYEVHVPDDYSIEEIRNGIFYSTKNFASTTNLDLQGETALKHVVIEKENTLYAIELSLFMSMRNAKEFVFDDQGSFIVPSYVGSNEDNYYLLEDYMSARNAANGSIAGAFALLSQNPEFIQDINPSIVRVVDGEIIFESSHWLLRDLGSEGSLDEPDNVYNIIDNTNFGYWSVSLLKSRLPQEFANADTFALTIRENTFTFERNQFNHDMYEVNITDSFSKEEIRDGIFEDKSDDSVVEYTLTIAVDGSGAVSPAVGSHMYREDVVVDLTATPSSGWKFKEWVGDVANTSSANTTVVMNKNQTVKAVFEKEENGVNETDDYMGLFLGSTWTYAVESHYEGDDGEEHIEGIVKLEVVEVEEQGNSTIFKRAYTEEFDEEMYLMLQKIFEARRQDSHRLMATDDDYWGEIIQRTGNTYELIGEFDYWGGEYTEYYFDEPMTILESPLKEGDVYTSPLWWFEMLVDKMDTVTVPYGTFNSWYMIEEESFTEDGFSMFIVIDTWFYPYIGEIKNSMEMIMSGYGMNETISFTMELMDFSH